MIIPEARFVRARLAHDPQASALLVVAWSLHTEGSAPDTTVLCVTDGRLGSAAGPRARWFPIEDLTILWGPQ
jgi:hypothetical protein